MTITKHARYEYTLTLGRVVINSFDQFLLSKDIRATGVYLDLGFFSIALINKQDCSTIDRHKATCHNKNIGE